MLALRMYFRFVVVVIIALWLWGLGDSPSMPPRTLPSAFRKLSFILVPFRTELWITRTAFRNDLGYLTCTWLGGKTPLPLPTTLLPLPLQKRHKTKTKN